ncbi:Phage terminase large subunit (GpA) [Thalassoglobus neptunius]|uniref:Phage terminase large subunit (GpA) n=1 Tax=Thalassoglobus neptunius TaxID=1938619 RepID=A0A5C5WEI3_9PLAN|nr:terminase gpA endonuclease subunit [Thalassoglobus neptunius]TWT49030.1 Phage terminase large subunit (GpA) [Thalassoglobus neptunius]
MISFVLAPEVYQCILPRERIATAEWLTSKLKLTGDSKLKGFYRLDLFPHFKEPCECFDDPEIEIITLQTAAQIGKTVWAQGCIAKVADTDPHPMAFADADEKSTKRVLDRMWRLFDSCESLSKVCPPPHRRTNDHMTLTTCVVHGAWAGSAATAADYGAFIVVLNETDKMKQRSTDTEADFRWLMQERTKGYVGRKVLQISTPSLTGSSFIEQQRLAGDNRARMVPCPHCNHFQELRTGNGKEKGGIKFEKLKDGKLSAAKARETAWYECEKCDKKIEEHHRYEMLNAGLWVPEGCVVKKGKITGEPARRGHHASFGPLSTLHSLLPGVTIGVYAEEYVKSLLAAENRRQARQNFVNSWEGNTFDPSPVTVQPNQVILRLGVDDPLRICPEWAVFLTLAGDVGRIAEELIFYWWVSAWGSHARGQLVDLGIAWDRHEMFDVIRSAVYPHADGGNPLRPVVSGFDSGSITNQVYELCKELPATWPIKGSSIDPDRPFVAGDFPEMYRPGLQRHGLNQHEIRRRLRAKRFDLLTANTQRSQEWVEDQLTGMIKREDPGWYSIPLEALQGQTISEIDLVKHLLGDYLDGSSWKKRYDDQHFRDAWRYSVILAWYHTANGRNWKNLTRRAKSAAKNTWQGARLRPTLRRPPGLTPGKADR